MKENQPTVSLSLTMNGADKALDFYTSAFNAKETYRMPSPEGGLAHGEFMIGNTLVYISDEADDWFAKAMPEGMMSSCLFSILVEDCDVAFAQAVAAGAEELVAPKDEFWGMRASMIKDPWGYRWTLSHIIEELTHEEIAKRAEEYYGGC